MLRHPTCKLALAVALTTGSALAFPSSRLTYVRGKGAEACPDESAVRHAVAARLGYDPFFPSADKIIVARIAWSRDELRATVELVDARGMLRGVREFKSSPRQCDELVAAMALAISIAIDPTNPAILGGTPAPARPEAKPAAAPVPSATAAKPPEAPAAEPVAPARARGESGDVPRAKTPEASRTSFRAGAAVLAALGTAPNTTAGLAIFGGVRRGPWTFQLEGRAELPATTAGMGGSVRTSLWAGGIIPCVHWDPVFLCATVWLGSLRAQGVGFSTSRVDRGVYAAAGGRIALELPLNEWLSFRPSVEFLTTLIPAELQVDGMTQWTAPQYATLLRAGLSARFP
jgi:hypothetical protein